MTIGITDVVVKRRGRTIIDRATLDLGPGIHGVIGRNGAGKTTLLRVLAGHMRIDSGTATGPSRPAVGSGSTALGRVAPDVRLAGSHVGAHLKVAAIGHPALDQALALAILSDAGVDEATAPKNLSSGQRQLLAAATALASGADTILLDEPFNGLDVGLRHALRDRIIAVVADRPQLCLVVTSHRSDDLVGLVDDVTAVHSGGIVAGPISLDTARHNFPTLRGTASKVDIVASKSPRLGAKSLGGITEVTLARPLSCSASRRADAEGVTITHPSDEELIDLIALHGATIGNEATTGNGSTARSDASERNQP